MLQGRYSRLVDPSDATGSGEHPRIDTSVAHSARVHDYWLGGTHNYPADRAAGDAVTASHAC